MNKMLAGRILRPARPSTSWPGPASGSLITSPSRPGPRPRWPRSGLPPIRIARGSCASITPCPTRSHSRPRSYSTLASSRQAYGATAGSPPPSALSRASRSNTAPRSAHRSPPSGARRTTPTLDWRVRISTWPTARSISYAPTGTNVSFSTST